MQTDIPGTGGAVCELQEGLFSLALDSQGPRDSRSVLLVLKACQSLSVCYTFITVAIHSRCCLCKVPSPEDGVGKASHKTVMG